MHDLFALNLKHVMELTDAEIEEYLNSAYASATFKVALLKEKQRRLDKGTENNPKSERAHSKWRTTFDFKRKER